ncbi:MAG: tRNA glutamyl-Q(34) synthetase GluQRS [Ilumatobacteraceae bacterium]
MTTGRFAPSPTGPLHVGNLRTALIAWLVARSAGGSFLLRMEDLDAATSSERHERSQLDDLAVLGIDHDGTVVRQRERARHYDTAIATLVERGLTYECYCTRREIRLEIERAVSAPHGPIGAYPGTCRDLTPAQRAARRSERPPAFRLRADDIEVTVGDEFAGTCTGVVDDFVLRRSDGVPAYNLAVVVDDADQGIDVVTRGDDLLESTPRQVLLQRLLGVPTPRHVHVPLVLGPDGQRLAKRHGAVTLADLAAEGVTAARVRDALIASLGLSPAPDLYHLAGSFDLETVRRRGRRPVTIDELRRFWM